MRVDGITSRVNLAADEDDVADLERADLFLGQRTAENDLAAGALEAGLIGHRRDWRGRIAIEPLLDGARLRVEHDPEAAERPAVVGNGDKEAGGQTIEHADLAADERRAPAKTHRADAELVDLAHDRRFELCKPRIGVDVV